MADASLLNEQGIVHNGDGITIEPNYVVMNIGATTIKIPMFLFKRCAEWYLEPQILNK